MISESLMSLGEIRVSFKPGTPRAVQNLPAYWDHLIVTPARVPDHGLTLANLLSIARFTARIDDGGYSDGVRELAGPSCLVWLGDHEGKGSFQAPTYGSISSTLGTMLVSFVYPGGGSGSAVYTNGLTLGGATGLSTNVIQDELAANETIRDAVDRWRQLTGTLTEYRCNPDGSVTYAPAGSSTIFAQTPNVIVSRMPGRLDHPLVGLRATTLNYTKNVSHYATDVTCEGSGGTTATASTIFTRPKRFDGAADAYLQARISANSNDATDVGNAAANALVFEFTTEWAFDVKVDVVDPGAYLIPGDVIYLLDLDSELYDTSNAVYYAGAERHPAKVRLFGYSWGLVPGMGLYLARTAGGSNQVVDLTDWVVFEPSAVTLRVGTDAPTLARILNPAA